ncbi:MAG: hypothetical protein AAGD18_12295 [Actinomycetota bacterium]
MRRVLIAGALVVAALVPGAPATAALQAAELVTGVGGTPGNLDSGGAAVSADGRFVAFHSRSSNLVSGDFAGHDDVFVLDRLTSTMSLVSRSTSGTPGDADSLNPAISDDGRFIAFQSDATDLVVGDTNDETDVFVHDRITGTTTRVSQASGGVDADDGSGVASISGDGRYVAFESAATNLTDGDDNDALDVFVADRTDGSIRLASVSIGGGPGDSDSFAPSLSRDGRYVAFSTFAADLFDGDDNAEYDIVLRDLTGGSTRRVSVGDTGGPLPGDAFDPAVDGDASHVAFRVTGVDGGVRFTDVRVWRAATGRSELVSVSTFGGPANAPSLGPTISADGDFVAFHSLASDLVAGDVEGQLDVFVRDLASGTTTRVSEGEERGGDERSLNASLSRDGSVVAFESDAEDLVDGASNGVRHVFLREGVTDGAPDVAPPEVVALDLTPRVVDVAAAEQIRSVTVTVRLADRTGALPPTLLLFDTLTGATTASVSATLASGTANDGTWTAVLTLPDDLDPGLWRLRLLDLRDGIGNSSPPITPDRFATDVVVVDGSADVTPPEAVSFGIDPSTVQTEIGGTVSFRLRARDASGVVAPEIEVVPPISGTSLGPVTMALASGDATDGEWLATLDVPPGASIGNWTVVVDSLLDGAGNLGAAGPPPGLPSTLFVVEGGGVPDGGTSSPPGDDAVPGDGDTGGTPGDGSTGGTPGGDGTPGGGVGTGGAPGDGSTGGSPGSGDPASPDGGAPIDGDAGSVALVNGYWMLGNNGNVHRFGDAAFHGGARAAVEGAEARAVDIEPTPSGDGYWILDDDGEVHAFGDATDLGDVVDSLPDGERAASLSATPTGDGYWVFTDRGRTLGFGLAEFFGDVSHLTLNGPVIDSVATPTGLGYYLVASDGGIFAFGDAEFRGSMGGVPLNQPVVGLAPTPDNTGYWLVAADGGVFAFDADFRGSMGSTLLNAPVSGMVAYGDGYLLVATDGGIFSFSDRGFDGSLGANPPNYPIVAVAPLPG